MEKTVGVALHRSDTVHLKKNYNMEDFQDGGVRQGNLLSPLKYIKNTSVCGTTPMKHLMKAGRRPQTSKHQFLDALPSLWSSSHNHT